MTVPSDSPSAAADWLELASLAQTRTLLRRSRIAGLLSTAAPDLGEEAVEALVADICAEVERRRERGGDLYPFDVDLHGIRRRDIAVEAERLYRFLLLCSVVPSFRQNQTGFQPGRAFERIAAVALERFTAGRSVVFADMAPTGVREKIRELGLLLHLKSHAGNARPKRKDHGLDVASWRSFEDQRAGHPIVLCQCTLSEEPLTLITKAREIQPGEWGTLLDVREGTLTAALAVPHVLEPGFEHWDDLRRNTDLIIERTRLLSLLEGDVQRWTSALPEEGFVNDAFSTWAEQNRD